MSDLSVWAKRLIREAIVEGSDVRDGVRAAAPMIKNAEDAALVMTVILWHSDSAAWARVMGQEDA